MHIVLTTNYSPWSPYSGGGQQSTHNLATALANRGHEIDVIYTKAPFERIKVPAHLEYKLHWAFLPSLISRRASWLRNFSIYSVRNKVKSLLRSQTIVHSSGEEGALVHTIKKDSKIPFVLTPRYPKIPDEIRYPNTTILSSFLHVKNTKYYLLSETLKTADVCTPTSKFTLQMLEKHYCFNQAKKEIIPNGVNELFLKAIPNQDITGPIVFFGRLAYSKGIDTLIEAFSLLKKLKYKLIIIGRGEIQNKLEKMAKKLQLNNQLTFKQWMSQKKLKATLEKASFVVLPSREESFGNTMAEAMATATPVISTTAGSIPEVIKDKKTGLLVPPNDPQALAEAMRNLISNPHYAFQMGLNGRTRVKKYYTWNAIAKQYERRYSEFFKSVEQQV